MCKLLPRSAIDRRGLSMVELLVSMAICVGLFAVVALLQSQTQKLFYLTDVQLELRDGLREAGERIFGELKFSGYNSAGTAQYTLQDNAGFGSSDILRFSVPVLCSSSATLLDASGNPAYWGAGLTWGCNSSSCMDADNDCSTVEYKYVEYSLDAQGKLWRKVLSPDLSTVRSDMLAQNINNLQFTVSGRTLTFTINASKNTVTGRLVSEVHTRKVFFSNYGGG